MRLSSRRRRRPRRLPLCGDPDPILVSWHLAYRLQKLKAQSLDGDASAIAYVCQVLGATNPLVHPTKGVLPALGGRATAAMKKVAPGSPLRFGRLKPANHPRHTP